MGSTAWHIYYIESKKITIHFIPGQESPTAEHSKDNLAVQVIVDVECLTHESDSVVPPGGHDQEGTLCRYATAKTNDQ